MWYVVSLWDQIISVQYAENEPYGTVLAGPFKTDREAYVALAHIRAEEATSSEIIGH